MNNQQWQLGVITPVISLQYQHFQQSYQNGSFEIMQPNSHRPLRAPPPTKQLQASQYTPTAMKVDLDWLRCALAEFYRINNPSKLSALEDVLSEFIRRGSNVEELDLLNEDLKQR
jgi:hypothetical protein